jgi:hypothetical protein
MIVNATKLEYSRYLNNLRPSEVEESEPVIDGYLLNLSMAAVTKEMASCFARRGERPSHQQLLLYYKHSTFFTYEIRIITKVNTSTTKEHFTPIRGSRGT